MCGLSANDLSFIVTRCSCCAVCISVVSLPLSDNVGSWAGIVNRISYYCNPILLRSMLTLPRRAAQVLFFMTLLVTILPTILLSVY